MATKDLWKHLFLSSFQIWLLFRRVLVLSVHICYHTQPVFKEVLSDSNMPEKKLLSSRSDVYLWVKTVFKHLERICQRTTLGNRSPAMPKGLQEKVFSIRGSTFPFFLSSDKLALKPWVHGLLWRALHATDCKGYTHTLAFVEFSLIIKGRNNITEEWSMILWELFSPQLWLSLRGFLKLHSWGFITTGVIQKAIEWG